MIGILIVDDNVQLREAVRAELEAQTNVCIVAEAGDGVGPSNSRKVSDQKWCSWM
jgi:hypothetical protein